MKTNFLILNSYHMKVNKTETNDSYHIIMTNDIDKKTLLITTKTQ